VNLVKEHISNKSAGDKVRTQKSARGRRRRRVDNQEYKNKTGLGKVSGRPSLSWGLMFAHRCLPIHVVAVVILHSSSVAGLHVPHET